MYKPGQTVEQVKQISLIPPHTQSFSRVRARLLQHPPHSPSRDPLLTASCRRARVGLGSDDIFLRCSGTGPGARFQPIRVSGVMKWGSARRSGAGGRGGGTPGTVRRAGRQRRLARLMKARCARPGGGDRDCKPAPSGMRHAAAALGG